MVDELPAMPEEFIPKFEEDADRRRRLNARKKAKEEREEKSAAFTPNLRKTYNELSDLMKHDLRTLPYPHAQSIIKKHMGHRLSKALVR